MKKILYLALLVGFAYSQTGSDYATGNTFLQKYPFEKVDNPTELEAIMIALYHGKISGFLEGNALTLADIKRGLNIIEDEQSEIQKWERLLNYHSYDDVIEEGMTLHQICKIVKKYCDDNPEQTHLYFEYLLFYALEKLKEQKN